MAKLPLGERLELLLNAVLALERRLKDSLPELRLCLLQDGLSLMGEALLLTRTVHQRIEDAQPHAILRKALAVNGKHVVWANLPATAHTMAIDDALELTPMAIKIRVSIL